VRLRELSHPTNNYKDSLSPKYWSVRSISPAALKPRKPPLNDSTLANNLITISKTTKTLIISISASQIDDHTTLHVHVDTLSCIHISCGVMQCGVCRLSRSSPTLLASGDFGHLEALDPIGQCTTALHCKYRNYRHRVGCDQAGDEIAWAAS